MTQYNILECGCMAMIIKGEGAGTVVEVFQEHDGSETHIPLIPSDETGAELIVKVCRLKTQGHTMSVMRIHKNALLPIGHVNKINTRNGLRRMNVIRGQFKRPLGVTYNEH